MKCLTVRQPWAHLIAQGGKDIENRTWLTHYRGPLIIHASQQMKGEDLAWVKAEHGIHLVHAALQRGVTICMVDLVDIVTESKSKWFEGTYGWVLKNPRPLPRIPMRGQMGLFNPPDEVVARLRR